METQGLFLFASRTIPIMEDRLQERVFTMKKGLVFVGKIVIGGIVGGVIGEVVDKGVDKVIAAVGKKKGGEAQK